MEREVRKKSLGKLTYKTYVSHLDNHILPAFGHMRLDQIQTMHLVTFINNLQKDGARKDGKDGVLASGTVEYIYRVAKNVFSRAVDWKLLKENPIDGVLKPKVEHQEMKYYEEDQAHPVIRKLYELAPVVWRMFSLGAMLGGFRRGELLGLEWPDVDFIENTLTVKRSISMTENGQAVRKDPKNTSSRRIVAMPEWYMAELKEYHKQWMVNYWKISELNKWLGGDHQVVFHAGFGKPFYHTQPSKWWAKFLKKHGFEHIRFHDLRHTSATILIENDAAMKAIQKRLGHSKYQTTADLYTHVTKKVSKATASKLDHLNPSPIRPQDQKESDTETFIPTMTNAQK